MGQSSLHQLGHESQFTHPEKPQVKLAATANDQILVAKPDVDTPASRTMRHEFSQCARDRAFDLLCDPAVEAHIDQLPFRQDAVIVTLSDTIADDRSSWAEILGCLLELRRPRDRIRVISAGIAGDTTCQMIARFLDSVQLRPDWIICAAGTSDARRQRCAPAKTQLSIEETGRNLSALRRMAVAQTHAQWIWMTPTPIIEARLIANKVLGPKQWTWKNADLAAIAALMHSLADPVVDLQSTFGCPPEPDMLLSDGLHPSSAGHAVIVRTLLETISRQPHLLETTAMDDIG